MWYIFIDWLDALPYWAYWVIAFVGLISFVVGDLFYGWIGKKIRRKDAKKL